MGNAYGKNALSVNVKMPNFDDYFAKIQAAGNDIDTLCIQAVDAATPIVESAMKSGAARHRKGVGEYGTDAVYDAIEITPTKKEGNLIYGKVGIDITKHPEASHAVYQEYGDGHSKDFPDEFVRPAYDENKAKVREVEVAVLKKGGIPVT